MSSPHLFPIAVNYTIQLRTPSVLNFLNKGAKRHSYQSQAEEDKNHTVTSSLTKFREAETQERLRRKGEHMACYGRRGGQRAGKGLRGGVGCKDVSSVHQGNEEMGAPDP